MTEFRTPVDATAIAHALRDSIGDEAANIIAMLFADRDRALEDHLTDHNADLQVTWQGVPGINTFKIWVPAGVEHYTRCRVSCLTAAGVGGAQFLIGVNGLVVNTVNVAQGAFETIVAMAVPISLAPTDTAFVWITAVNGIADVAVRLLN